MSLFLFKKRSSFLYKLMAAALSIVLFITNCAFASATESFFYARRKNLLAKLPSSPHAPFFLPPHQLKEPLLDRPRTATPALSAIIDALPHSAGTTRTFNVKNPHQNNKLVILIQDVHQNLEAQTNISSTVGSLLKNNLAQLVALEGSYEKINFAPFRLFPYQSSVKKTADFLLTENKISGAAHSALTDPYSKVVFAGVEDGKLYNANVESVRSAFTKRTALLSQLGSVAETIKTEKDRTWNKNLLSFDQEVQDYRNGTAPLSAYARRLSRHYPSTETNTELFLQAAALESKLNFQQAGTERSMLLQSLMPKLNADAIAHLTEKTMAYRMGRLDHAAFYRFLKKICMENNIPISSYPAFNTYVQYSLMVEAIQPEKLFENLHQMEHAIYLQLCRSKTEKNLWLKSEQAFLLSRLLDFSLTSTQWDYYRSLKSVPSLLNKSDTASFEAFYSIADQRNESIVRNLILEMNQNSAKTAVLVAGGFHTKGVSDIFKRNNIDFIIFAPRITKLEPDDGASALSIFNQEKTPLDQLFEGTRLFLAPNPASPAALRMGAAITVSDALRLRAISFDIARNWFRNATGWVLQSFSTIGSTVRLQWKTSPAAPTTRLATVDFPVDSIGRLMTPQHGYGQWAMNSTFILAPILTALTHMVFYGFETPHLLSIISFWFGYKIILFASVFLHERAHLKASGQFAGHSPREISLKTLESLRMDRFSEKNISAKIFSTLTAFMVGYDIVNAYIISDKQSSDNVRKIAIAGPLANIFIMVIGLALWTSGKIAETVSLDFATYFQLLGFILISSNASLLLLNIGGTDYKAFVTGAAPPVYRMGSGQANAPLLEAPKKIELEGLDESEGTISRMESAKTIMVTLPEGIEVNTNIRALIFDFLRETLNKSVSRNAKKVALTRIVTPAKITFIVEDDSDLIEEDKESFSFHANVETLKAEFNLKSRGPGTKGMLASLTVPTIMQNELRELPREPEQPDDVNSLFDEWSSLKKSDAVEFENKVADVRWFLKEHPDAVSTYHLFFFLRIPDDEIRKASLALLLERLGNNIDPKTIPFLHQILGYDQGTTTHQIKQIAAVSLWYLASPKHSPTKGLNYNIIKFWDLDRKTIQANKKQHHRLHVEIKPKGIVVITAPRVRNRLFGVVDWIPAMVGMLGGNSPRRSQQAILHFTMSRPEDDAPGTMDEILKSLTHVKLAIKGKISAEALNAIIKEWAWTCPVGTKVSVNIQLQGNTFQQTPTGNAFDKTGFELTGLDKDTATLEKISHPKNPPSAGINQSPLSKFFSVFLALFYPMQLLDEGFHILSAKLFSIPIDWSETSLLQLNPHVAHFPVKPLQKVIFSIAAPIGWALIFTAFLISYIFIPQLHFFNIWETGPYTGLIWLTWYLGGSSALMLLANLIPSEEREEDGMTDLQLSIKYWKIHSKRSLQPEVRRLPQLKPKPGRAHSPLFGLGHRIATFIRTRISRLLSRVAPADAAAIIKELHDSNFETGAGSARTVHSQLKNKVSKLLASIEKALQRKFPENIASASHNYGYWLMEARERIRENGIFIGSSLDKLSARELEMYLTEDGLKHYRNRYVNLNDPTLQSHLVQLKHFKPSYIRHFYSVMGRPEMGKKAELMLADETDRQHVIIDMFARPWRTGEDEAGFSSLDAIRNQPHVLKTAKARQLKFVAMAMALHKANKRLRYSQDVLLKLLWQIMLLTDYQEQESLGYSTSRTQDRFEEREGPLWERYDAQLKNILSNLPESAINHSPLYNLGQRLAQYVAAVFIGTGVAPLSLLPNVDRNLERSAPDAIHTTAVPGGSSSNPPSNSRNTFGIINDTPDSIKNDRTNDSSVGSPDTPATESLNRMKSGTFSKNRNQGTSGDPSSNLTLSRNDLSDLSDPTLETIAKSNGDRKPESQEAGNSAHQDNTAQAGSQSFLFTQADLSNGIADRNSQNSGFASPEEQTSKSGLARTGEFHHDLRQPEHTRSKETPTRRDFNNIPRTNPPSDKSNDGTLKLPPLFLATISGIFRSNNRNRSITGGKQNSATADKNASIRPLRTLHGRIGSMARSYYHYAATLAILFLFAAPAHAGTSFGAGIELSSQIAPLFLLFAGALFSLSLLEIQKHSAHRNTLPERTAHNFAPIFANGFSLLFTTFGIGVKSDQPHVTTDLELTAPIFVNSSYIQRATATNIATAIPGTSPLGSTSIDSKALPGNLSRGAYPIAVLVPQTIPIFVVAHALGIFSQNTERSPVSILSAIGSNDESALEKSILLQLSKAVRRAALLLASERNVFDNEARDTSGLDLSDEKLELVQIQKTALILREEILTTLKDQRSTHDRTNARELEILNSLLQNPLFLENIALQFGATPRDVRILRLDPSSQRKKTTSTNSTPPQTADAKAEEEVPEDAVPLHREPTLLILPAVEAAAEIIGQESRLSKLEALSSLSVNSFLGNKNNLAVQFAQAALQIFSTDSKPHTFPTYETQSNIASQVQSAAAFLSEEGSRRSASNLKLGKESNFMPNVLNKAPTILIIGAAALIAIGLSQWDFTTNSLLQGTLVFAAGALVPYILSRIKNGQTKSDLLNPLLPTNNETAGQVEAETNLSLEETADVLIALAQTVIQNRRAATAIDFDNLLPAVTTLGVSGEAAAATLQTLSKADQESLQTILSRKIKTKLGNNKLSLDEARQVITWLLTHGRLAVKLQDRLGNKNAVMAVEGGSAQQLELDAQMVGGILTTLGPKQKLILLASGSENDLRYIQKRFSSQINAGRIELRNSIGILSREGEKRVFNFEKLANELSQLEQAELGNLVVLIQNGITWNAANLDSVRALGLVSFILLRDFVSGVPVERVDILHIEKLARLLAIQS